MEKGRVPHGAKHMEHQVRSTFVTLEASWPWRRRLPLLYKGRIMQLPFSLETFKNFGRQQSLRHAL